MVDLIATLTTLEPYLIAGVILLLTWLIAILVGRLVAGFTRGSSAPVSLAARRVASAIVWIAGATIAVQEAGINPAVLFLILAFIGVGLIIALRLPIESAGARYFSDSYMPFKVGDSIRILGVSGKVLEINAITTVLLAENDDLISVPNSAFVREIVVNTSPGAWKELTIPVSIGPDVDLATFESDLIRSLAKLKLRLDARFPPILATKARSAQSTDLVLTLMLRRPEEREALTLDVNQRVAETLKRARARRT